MDILVGGNQIDAERNLLNWEFLHPKLFLVCKPLVHRCPWPLGLIHKCRALLLVGSPCTNHYTLHWECTSVDSARAPTSSPVFQQEWLCKTLLSCLGWFRRSLIWHLTRLGDEEYTFYFRPHCHNQYCHDRSHHFKYYNRHQCRPHQYHHYRFRPHN